MNGKMKSTRQCCGSKSDRPAKNESGFNLMKFTIIFQNCWNRQNTWNVIMPVRNKPDSSYFLIRIRIRSKYPKPAGSASRMQGMQAMVFGEQIAIKVNASAITIYHDDVNRFDRHYYRDKNKFGFDRLSFIKKKYVRECKIVFSYYCEGLIHS